MSKKKSVTIVLIENYWEGYLHSIMWFASLAAMMAIAVYLQSSAMQWVMGILWTIALIGATAQRIEKIRMTPDEAIARIKEIKDKS